MLICLLKLLVSILSLKAKKNLTETRDHMFYDLNLISILIHFVLCLLQAPVNI